MSWVLHLLGDDSRFVLKSTTQSNEGSIWVNGHELNFSLKDGVMFFTKNTVTHTSNIDEKLHELRKRIDDAKMLLKDMLGDGLMTDKDAMDHLRLIKLHIDQIKKALTGNLIIQKKID